MRYMHDCQASQSGQLSCLPAHSYNKEESDFEGKRAYDDFLEEREDISEQCCTLVVRSSHQAGTFTSTQCSLLSCGA